MKLTKQILPAHREFFLVVNRVTSRGPERLEYYDCCCYRQQAQAQARADLMNAHRNTARNGTVTVEYVDRPQSVQWATTLRF